MFLMDVHLLVMHALFLILIDVFLLQMFPSSSCCRYPSSYLSFSSCFNVLLLNIYILLLLSPTTSCHHTVFLLLNIVVLPLIFDVLILLVIDGLLLHVVHILLLVACLPSSF